jgi:hypothetical protein
VVGNKDQRESKIFKGPNVPGQVPPNKRTVQFGVSRGTRGVVEATSGDRGLPVEIITNPVGGYGEAKYDAAGAQKSMMDQAAMTATFTGDATITPGSPIRFDASHTAPDQIGLWLVNEATHTLSNTEFVTTVSASRDTNRRVTSRVPDLVRREGGLAKAVVRNGVTWEAEMQETLDA